MTSILKDKNQTSVVDPKIDLTVQTNNFKLLKSNISMDHFEMLEMHLGLLTELISEKLSPRIRDSCELCEYIRDIEGSLDAYILKNRIESMTPNSDISISCSIDPSDSGFPILFRDFHFLGKDKEKASGEQRPFREDNRMIDDALFSIFRGVYPEDVILEKLHKAYCRKLLDIELPVEFKMYPEETIEEKGTLFCKKFIRRFNGDENLPQFYILYFKIPAKEYAGNKTQWKERLDEAILAGISTIKDLELPYMAKNIEAIEKIRLEMIDRFDIGPFYNRHTENDEPMHRLFEDGEERDAILMFRKFSTQRIGEKRNKGLINWFRKQKTGFFSPAIASPLYALMPHRLIQKIYHKDIRLADNLKMHGLTKEGELID